MVWSVTLYRTIFLSQTMFLVIRKMDCERTENDVKLLDLEAFGLKTDGWQTYLAGTKLEMMKCWRKWKKAMLDVHNFEERAVKLALFASVI